MSENSGSSTFFEGLGVMALVVVAIFLVGGVGYCLGQVGNAQILEDDGSKIIAIYKNEYYRLTKVQKKYE